MYTTETDQRNLINMLGIGIAILVVALIAIAVAASRHHEETTDVQTYEMSQPVAPPVQTQTEAPAPPQIIEVQKPVVETVPVPVPVTHEVIREVPSQTSSDTAPASGSQENVQTNPRPSARDATTQQAP